MKLLKGAASKNMKADFVREALLSFALGNHPNSVQILSCAVQQAPWLVVLELLQYGDLRGLLLAAASKGVVLEPGDVLYIPACAAHEIGGEHGADHVLSVNRFWHTLPSRVLPHLPDAETEQGFRSSPGVSCA